MAQMMSMRPVYTCIVLFALFSWTLGEVTERSGNLTLVCQSGWRLWGSSCYLWVSSEMQYSDARQLCLLYQSNLLQIEDEVESVTIAGLAPLNPLWVDRQITDRCFGYWDDGEPNVDAGAGVCAGLHGNGLWGVVSCHQPLPFFCERPACIEGSFDCGHGGCVSRTRKCDGINDCGNNLDEMNCGDPQWPTPVPCSYRMVSETGSVDYNLQGDSYLDCLWTIISSPGTQIKLTFTHFDLEDNLDTLEVRGGGQTMLDSQVLDTLTGSGSRRIHSLNNMVILRLLTDWSSKGLSFQLQWSASKRLRNWTVESDWKDLFTPYFYDPPTRLPFYSEWLVTSTEEEIITLRIKDVDVKGEWNILVYNGDSFDDVLVNASKVVDFASPAVYFSTSRVVRVVLRGQDITRDSKGILIQARTGCDMELNEYPGILSSPGFGQNAYPSSLVCGWLLNIPHGYGNTITLKFYPLHLLTEDSFVEILNGSTASSPPLFIGSKYTGDYRNSPINIEGVGPLFVRFVSSPFSETGGFNMSFSIDCEPIPSTQGLVKSSSSTSVGSPVQVSCQSGFAFRQQEFYSRASVVLTCLWTGRWNVKRMPSCGVVYCGAPPPVLSGYVESYSGSVKHGSTATYNCYTGYQLVGNAVVTCLDTGQWSTPPTCESTTEQVTCGEAPDVSNAWKVYLSSYGDIVEYRCEQGYEIIGSPRRLCQKNGSWSLSSPSCVKLRCPLPEVRNGEFTTSAAVEFGSTVYLVCDHGYVLSSTNIQAGVFVCGVDKTFGDGLVCEDVDECRGSVCQENQVCVNTAGGYTCQCGPGFKPGVGSQCINIDECSERTHRCEQVCTDLLGSYTCTCYEGYTLRQEGDNFACYKLDQSDSDENAGCPALTPMGTATQRNLVRGIYPATSLLPGQSVTVVCGRPDGSTENRTLYCAYASGTQGFSLQGDSPVCEVIDCGSIEVHKGQVAPALTDTEYWSSFVYQCMAGAELTGQSRTGDNMVRCFENGAWGYGSLSCTVGKCGDPGTPAGTIQMYESYEMGSHVTYRCVRVGYSLSHNSNLTCVLQFGVLQWNHPPPTCSDVTPPTFTSCESGEMTLKVNKMDIPDISMTATDTSDPVKSISVSPATFNTGDPILSDTVVSYTATDHSGNVAVCRVDITVKDPNPGFLECPNLLTYPLTSANTLMDSVSDRLVFRGGQLVNPPQIEVSPRTLNTELDYRVTLQTEDGVNASCSFRVKVVAGSCFHDTSNEADNAVTTHVEDSAYTTRVTCRDDYSFQDGGVSRIYTCTGANQWSPGDPSQPCLAIAYKMSYHIQLQTTSDEFHDLDSYCRLNVSSVYSYLSSSDSLLNNLCDRGQSTGPDRFYRFRLVSAEFEDPFHEFRHIMSLSLQLENYDGDLSSLEDCSGLISSRKTDLFTVNTDECGFKVELLLNASTATGDTCGTGYNDTGDNDLCLMCPPGTYWLSDGTCEECPDGYYQNLAGQIRCIPCSADASTSVLPRTSAKNCIRYCVDGFVSSTGETPCEVCGVDTYWSSPTVCTPCPNEGSTLSTDGAPDITYCKDPCQEGTYSVSGFAPCTLCPHHFYQSSVGQTFCYECWDNEVTESPGSTFSGACQAIETSQNSCSECFTTGTQSCEYQKHRGVCNCKPGYTGSRCETLYNHCESIPCFNNGACTQLVNAYACTCNDGSFGDNCEEDITNDCVNNNCSEDSVCRDMVAGYQCVCDDSEDKDDRCFPLDSDPCTPNPCHYGGSCLSEVQGRIQCLCQPGTTGTMCDSIIDNCELNPSGCLYGGTCINAINSYTCDCRSGLEGDHCQLETRTCASGFCRNGVCTSQGECSCLQPYKTDEDGECTVYDHCASNPCGVGSENCITHSEGYECVCREGYEGVRCQFKVDYCKVDYCLHGSCQSGNTDYTCQCEDGWQGRWCHESVDDCPGQCTSTSAASCQDLHLDFTCICKSGYTGKNCTVDIDECASLPCQHGSTCSQGLADYTCTCMEGWEGKNCENIKNSCTTDSCLNDGLCYNVFNGHYCSCHKGTFGERCEVAPDMCNIVQPCLPTFSTSCQSSNGTALCNCLQTYSGASCQLVKDCSASPCQNGATCMLESPFGYSCHCALGFSGTHCENLICHEVCPVGTTCVYEGFHTYCLCPAPWVLSGSECIAFSSDFDLYLEGGSDIFSTRSPPFKLSNSITLMMWVGYFNSGRSLLLSKLDSTLALMELYHDRVVFEEFNRNVTLNFENSDLEQVKGQWSHVTVTWSDDNIFTVFINGIQIKQKTLNTDIHTSDNLYTASFDTEFTGYISQLTVWSRVLSITDIRSAAQSGNYDNHDDLELGWTRYVLNGLSRTFRPSRARLDARLCESDRVQAPNCQDAQGDNKYTCPESHISFTTEQRVTSIGNVIALPSTDLQQTYYTTITGSFVSWGRHDVVLVLKDVQERYTICRVKLYIRDLVSCDTSGFPDNILCGPDSVLGLCGPGKHPSVPTPDILQCGRLGSFNLTHPTSSYSPPPCGDITDVSMRMTLTLIYRMGLQCTDLSRNTLVRLLGDQIESYLSESWPQLCVAGCSSLNMRPKCDDASVIVDVIFDDVPVLITKADTGITTSTETVLYIIATKTTELEVPSIGKLDKGTVTVRARSLCNGTTVSRKCVSCGPGSYIDQSVGHCQRCPIGTYTDASGQLSCTPCLDGKTTAFSGSKTMADCILKCPAGSMVGDEGFCTACPRGYYQHSTGQVFCFPCPVDKTTADISATSMDDCIDPEGITSKLTSTSTAFVPTTSDSRDDTRSLPSSIPSTPQTTSAPEAENILDEPAIYGLAAAGGGLVIVGLLVGCCYKHRRRTRRKGSQDAKTSNKDSQIDTANPIYEEIHPEERDANEAYITAIYSSEKTPDNTVNYYSVLNDSSRGDNSYNKIKKDRKSSKTRSRHKPRDLQRTREQQVGSQVFHPVLRGTASDSMTGPTPYNSRRTVSDNHLDSRIKWRNQIDGPLLRIHNGQRFVGFRNDRF